MQKKFLIIDQGYYRDNNLASLVVNDPQVRFIIPDVAFIEMCKSNSWENTIRQSLKFLSGAPNRVYAGISVGEAIRFEIKNRQSSNGHLICRRFTPIVRSLLKEIRSGINGSAFAKFHSEVGIIREELTKEALNHQQNLMTLTELVEATRDSLEKDILKSLRNGSITGEEITKLALLSAPNLMSQFFEMVNFPKNRITSFLKTKPLAFRLILLIFWWSLDWIAQGGLESLPAKKATNDFLDQEYVLIATFFHGILSKDNRINQAYKAMQCMLKN
ncbi:MAG: hypothetical protein V3U75_07610 [Methylococcaceae bacterium]